MIFSALKNGISGLFTFRHFHCTYLWVTFASILSRFTWNACLFSPPIQCFALFSCEGIKCALKILNTLFLSLIDAQSQRRVKSKSM